MCINTAAPLVVSSHDQQILESWAQKDRTSSLAKRAEIILMAGRGVSNAAIARHLDVTRPTVINWRRRYQSEGVLGLQDRPRPGRRRAVDDVEVILRTLVEPTSAAAPQGRWSSRLLAARLGVSNGTVARIWRRWGLKPDDLHNFQLPTIPTMSLSSEEVIGLFCTPRDQILILKQDAAGKPSCRATRSTAMSQATQICEVVDSFLWNPHACPSYASTPDPSARIWKFLLKGLSGAGNRPVYIVTSRTVSLRHPDIQRLIQSNPLVKVVCPAGEVGWTSVASLLIGWNVTRSNMAVPECFASTMVQMVDEFVHTVSDHDVEFSWIRESVMRQGQFRATHQPAARTRKSMEVLDHTRAG